MNQFGCHACWPDTLDAADAARRKLSNRALLIDESHFIVAIRICPKCAQNFLSVFAEMIDWEGGEDPQHWTLLPITESEAQELIRQGNSLPEQALYTLGEDRRSLQHDHPKNEPPQTRWGAGIPRVPHD